MGIPKASALQLEDLTSKQKPPLSATPTSPWHRGRLATLVLDPQALPTPSCWDPTPSEATLSWSLCPCSTVSSQASQRHSAGDTTSMRGISAHSRETTVKERKGRVFLSIFSLFIKMPSWTWSSASPASFWNSGLVLYRKLRPHALHTGPISWPNLEL